MRYYYDLHLHSCLSPCGDRDMTPYNLVNMAAINELDIIALTDHNTAKNCPAALQAARDCGMTLLCGMELNTSEDIHVVCLFPGLDEALAFDAYVHARLPDIRNEPDVFGEQLILDAQDQVVGTEQTLLISGADISVSDLPALSNRFSMVCFPAHIDKSSYSILASLGAIPPECGFHAAEISARGDVAALTAEHPTLREMPLLLSSDAHYLEDIHPRRAWLDLPERSAKAALDALSGRCIGFGRG